MPRNAQAYAAAIKHKLDRVPAAVQAAVVKAQSQNGDEMVALAKSLAPERTGALRASIHKEANPAALSVKVVAGDAKAYYARFVEFGTQASTEGETLEFATKLTLDRGEQGQKRRRKAKRTHPGTKAQPFFFPSYRALKTRMKGRATRAANKAIKDSAAGA